MAIGSYAIWQKATHAFKVYLNDYVDPFGFINNHINSFSMIIFFDYNNTNKYKYSNKIKIINI